MKLLTAIIQPDKLDEVREALLAAQIQRITVSRCTGRARGDASPELFRGREVAPTLQARVRIDIALNDDFVDRAIEAILAAARHGPGEQGDGKIFVVPLEQCIRIRTGESGPGAI
ncbi:MAG: P-II family nitrogen regulator [Myxococcales bacterium]|nr:P-II family nitrogen regulator [Myxococcales bacterium]